MTEKNSADLVTAKTGVLIANLGTPDGTDYWSMRRFLREFLSDKRVIDYPRWKWLPLLHIIILSKRPFTSGRAYRSIWNTEKDESPLLTITREQTGRLKAVIADRFGEQVVVEYCMRYGNPSTAKGIQSLIAQGCTKIIFLPLYPQYAGATTGTANDQFFRALQDLRAQPAIQTIGAYYDNPAYIKALAASVRAHYENIREKPDVLVASYHGLPERYIRDGDPYYDHCTETTQLLRKELGWRDDQIVTAFQSKFGPEEWIKPATVDEVARLAKAGKSIAVIAPSFSTDCIETLEEINQEIREAYEEAGGTGFSYIPCLNSDAAHIDLMADLVSAQLGQI